VAQSLVLHKVCTALFSIWYSFSFSCPAVAAAPAENVRILMEGSSSYNSWSHAWKEVFRGAEVIEPSVSIKQSRDQARQVYSWMKDVKQMAGRG